MTPEHYTKRLELQFDVERSRASAQHQVVMILAQCVGIAELILHHYPTNRAVVVLLLVVASIVTTYWVRWYWPTHLEKPHE